MKAFNLEKALAGEKVVTRDGREVIQVAAFKGVRCDRESIYALIDGKVEAFHPGGSFHSSQSSDRDLFMGTKKLSGFINDYATHSPQWHATREHADMDATTKEKRIACIDLSQFEEGHGLTQESK